MIETKDTCKDCKYLTESGRGCTFGYPKTKTTEINGYINIFTSYMGCTTPDNYCTNFSRKGQI